MKNKGTIKFFAIALAVVSLFHLSFTLVTYLKEKRAKEYAESTVTRYKQQNPEATNDQIDSVFKYHEDEYLDSIAFQNDYNILLKKYTYAECKERELNLGLDLQGGMHITLEVSLEDLLRELSNNSTDSVFLKAIESAREKQEKGQLDFIRVLGNTTGSHIAGSKASPYGELEKFLVEVEDINNLTTYIKNATSMKKIPKEKVIQVVSAVFKSHYPGAFWKPLTVDFNLDPENIKKIAKSAMIEIEEKF